MRTYATILLLSLLACSRGEEAPAQNKDDRPPGPALLHPSLPEVSEFPARPARQIVPIDEFRFATISDGEVRIFSHTSNGWVSQAVLEQDLLQVFDAQFVDCIGDGSIDILFNNPVEGRIEVRRAIGDGKNNEPVILGNSGPRTSMLHLKGEGCGTLVTEDQVGLRLRKYTKDWTQVDDRSFPLEGDCVQLRSADLDGDGSEEILARMDLEDSERLILFVPKDGSTRILAERPSLSTFSVGDVNGDGLPDVVLAMNVTGQVTTAAGELAVLLNRGHGLFSNRTVASAIPRVRASTIGDFDGDGRADIAWASANQGIIGVSYQEADGSYFTQVIWSALNATLAAISGSDRALLVVGPYQGGLLLLRDDGARTWSGRRGTLLGSQPFGVATIDLDRDGRLEYAVSFANDRKLAIADQLGRVQSIDLGETMPGPIVNVDFGCDGGESLVVLDSSQYGGTGKVVSSGPSGLQILKEFNHKTALDAQVADMDGDGRPDIVLAGFAVGGHVEVIWNEGRCTFDQRTDHALEGAISPMAVAVGDFHSTGRRQVAIADFHERTVLIASVRRDGWTVEHRVDVGGHPIAVAACDWDGIPADELVVASHLEGEIGVFRVGGDEPSRLESYSTRSSHGRKDIFRPRSLIAGDFDGDGKCDFISGGTSGSYFSVMSRNDRALHEGIPNLLGGGTAVDLEIVSEMAGYTLVVASSGDDILFRSRMELIPVDSASGKMVDSKD